MAWRTYLLLILNQCEVQTMSLNNVLILPFDEARRWTTNIILSFVHVCFQLYLAMDKRFMDCHRRWATCVITLQPPIVMHWQLAINTGSHRPTHRPALICQNLSNWSTSRIRDFFVTLPLLNVTGVTRRRCSRRWRWKSRYTSTASYRYALAIGYKHRISPPHTSSRSLLSKSVKLMDDVVAFVTFLSRSPC